MNLKLAVTYLMLIMVTFTPEAQPTDSDSDSETTTEGIVENNCICMRWSKCNGDIDRT